MVASQVSFAQDLGKPILPLLLGGTGFANLAQLPSENVTTGAMPSAAFVTRLRSFVPPAFATNALRAPPAPPARRPGLIVGIVAAAVIGVLVLVCVGGAFLFPPDLQAWGRP